MGDLVKDNDGRVHHDDFMAYFQGTDFAKAANYNGHEVSYEFYLAEVFGVANEMMPKPHDYGKTIGQHCFNNVMHLPFTYFKSVDGKDGSCIGTSEEEHTRLNLAMKLATADPCAG